MIKKRLAWVFIVILEIIFAQRLIAESKESAMPTSDKIHFQVKDPDEIMAVLPYDMEQYKQKVLDFYQSLGRGQIDLDVKIKASAEYFLDQPYFLEPLGEGPTAKYSQEPLFRTDKFDCVSYINTVLSLTEGVDFSNFKNNMMLIRYGDKQFDYIYRTDWFTDLEWLPNARKLGWIKDITPAIVNETNKAIFKTAVTLIEKSNWYRVKPFKALHLLKPRLQEEKAQILLYSLRSKAHLFKAHPSTLSYIPLDKLFHNGQPNKFIFNQIPSGSVIAIVRPNWSIRDSFPGFPKGYGTNLNVSHLGIGIRTEKGLMFYNASVLRKKVIAEPLADYLKRYLDSPTIKGIHVEKIKGC